MKEKDWVEDRFSELGEGCSTSCRDNCPCYRAEVQGEPTHWDCGLGVTKELGKLKYNCFKPSCNLYKGGIVGKTTIKDYKERAKMENLKIQRTLELPPSFTPGVKEQGYHWVRNNGLYKEDIIEHRIGTNNDTGNVVFPVYDELGELVWYQERNLQEYGAKWISPSTVDFGTAPVFITSNEGLNGIIVEDIPSAIVSGRQMPSCALLGTKASDKKVSLILKWISVNKIQKVLVCLDGDVYEQAKGLKKFLQSYVPEVEVIKVTGKDPKYWTPEQFDLLINKYGIKDPNEYIKDSAADPEFLETTSSEVI